MGQIDAKHLTNIALVVVRYFGGTKLGVGGMMNGGCELQSFVRNFVNKDAWNNMPYEPLDGTTVQWAAPTTVPTRVPFNTPTNIPTSVPTSSIPSSSTTSTTSIVPINQYHVHLRAITETIDLNLLFNGITRLLNNIPESNNTYLPNSQKQIKSYQEILIILW